ncbi:conserved hypothetical protein [Hahella chejuensis KCTC 2396]|uniref:DUF1266 domain-containing protein n=1 Tax=Hahella chejuensis (strain KCTC 2396) TaxID=349521 RepID=Q2S9A8_HAHCH|nr:DUF1266 domain-containing protein [Hahella chejuensis]ABC32766.1 conserved hypothetical protein [Hahella chejuensis KCTC 2396]
MISRNEISEAVIQRVVDDPVWQPYWLVSPAEEVPYHRVGQISLGLHTIRWQYNLEKGQYYLLPLRVDGALFQEWLGNDALMGCILWTHCDIETVAEHLRTRRDAGEEEWPSTDMQQWAWTLAGLTPQGVERFLGPIESLWAHQKDGSWRAFTNPSPCSPAELAVSTRKPKPLSDSQLWALAVPAILTEFNRARHDLLGSEVTTPESIQSWKEGLKDWWSVTDRESLLETLDWLLEGGHRAGFNKLREQVMQLDSEQYQAAWEANEDEELRANMKIIRRYSNALGEPGIASWDIGRYISLCRWGYLVGMLTEEEAWERILHAARAVQGMYHSWRQMGLGYVVGRMYWQSDASDEHMTKFFNLLRRQTVSPDSYWVRLPWDLDLGGEKEENHSAVH